MEEKHAVRPSEPYSSATSVLIPATPDDPGPQPPNLFRPRKAEVEDMMDGVNRPGDAPQWDGLERCRSAHLFRTTSVQLTSSRQAVATKGLEVVRKQQRRDAFKDGKVPQRVPACRTL